MLTLEEAGLAKKAASASASAMVVSAPRDANSGQSRGKNKNQKKSGGGRNSSTGGGSGQNTGGQQPSRGGGPQQQQPAWAATPPWQHAYQPYQPWGWAPWAAPPCPYPTQGWAKQQQGPMRQQQGVLGPRPQQVYMANPQQQSMPYAPTDIESAMHTMTLSQPDPSWYMDTGATSHMTSSNGNLSSYFNLSNHYNGIIVGSGHTIPIHGCGHTTLPSPNPPLSLTNVLHAPKIIKKFNFC
ncbi:uncharacterized protein LOC110710614 [Chenopodium quinoa]|uniref:uncharacterized protein LOC110710614 n=1 Tax=Chenopodium quinoa TaxID=63459 RepID=UPI000B77ACA2|nr:uncharacterized protein LOC110710614 [Chenopodium quinoa]